MKSTLAPTGTTGNNTHTGISIQEDYDLGIILFVVEAVGATPTVTWKVQGSIDSTNGADGNWFDCGYLTDTVDTMAVATRTMTAVGAQIAFLTRPYAWLRLVTTANTNVTYRALVQILRSQVA